MTTSPSIESIKRTAIVEFLDKREMEALQALEGKIVIAIGNEVTNVRVYKDVVLPESSTVLQGINVITNKLQTLWGECEEFTVAKFKLYNKLTPHERILLKHPYIEEEEVMAKQPSPSRPLVHPAIWEQQVFTALGINTNHFGETFECPLADFPNHVEIARYSFKDVEHIVLSSPDGQLHVYNNLLGYMVQPNHDVEGVIRYLAHTMEALSHAWRKTKHFDPKTD